MKYTNKESARLLANRVNQPHYISAIIQKCIDESMDWISIEDRVPPIFETVLCWNKHANARYGENTYRLATYGAENMCDVSHWMLLPKPPKTK